MCIYVFIYMCVHIYIHMYMYIHACTYVRMYVCMYVCMYACIPNNLAAVAEHSLSRLNKNEQGTPLPGCCLAGSN